MESISINGEKINLKHSKIFGWGVVNPIKDENGNVNIVNLLFGGKNNLITLIVMLIIVTSFMVQSAMTFESCKKFIEHPEYHFKCCGACGLNNTLGLTPSVFYTPNITNE